MALESNKYNYCLINGISISRRLSTLMGQDNVIAKLSVICNVFYHE